MLKLIDLERLDKPEKVELGTCDYCFRIEKSDKPIVVFENSKGEKVKINAYYIDYDSKDIEEIHVDNIVDFAAFIAKKQLPDDYFDFGDDEYKIYSTLLELTIEYGLNK